MPRKKKEVPIVKKIEPIPTLPNKKDNFTIDPKVDKKVDFSLEALLITFLHYKFIEAEKTYSPKVSRRYLLYLTIIKNQGIDKLIELSSSYTKFKDILPFPDPEELNFWIKGVYVYYCIDHLGMKQIDAAKYCGYDVKKHYLTHLSKFMRLMRTAIATLTDIYRVEILNSSTDFIYKNFGEQNEHT